MAQTRSATKRIRQIKRRSDVNQRRMNTLRTQVRKVEAAIAAGDRSKAQAALRAAQPHLMRAAQKRVVHRNSVSRKLARLSKRIKAMAA
ncbi:MAG TPA: 30S ribosomal protein S20 [Rhodospirillales bacterium]|jgi:small subunit ribosomal protein S20